MVKTLEWARRASTGNTTLSNLFRRLNSSLLYAIQFCARIPDLIIILDL